MSDDTLTVRCAWCGKDLDAKARRGVSGEMGRICARCYRQQMQALALDERAAYYAARLKEGHRNKAVLTRWRREVLKAKALAACLRDGRRRGPWDAYLEEVRK